MAVIQIYVPSRAEADKALNTAQQRGKGKGPKSDAPVAQAQAALTEVDQAEHALNDALAAGFEIRVQYPALHSVGVNLILYKEDPK